MDNIPATTTATPTKSDVLAQITDELEGLLSDSGVKIPAQAKRIASLVVLALNALKSLVPAEKQAEIEEVSQAVLQALEAGRNLEKELAHLHLFAK